jgi:hypothetical protein
MSSIGEITADRSVSTGPGVSKLISATFIEFRLLIAQWIGQGQYGRGGV